MQHITLRSSVTAQKRRASVAPFLPQIMLTPGCPVPDVWILSTIYRFWPRRHQPRQTQPARSAQKNEFLSHQG